jgi:glycosyltransferase involved in cell wall biosynthesis
MAKIGIYAKLVDGRSGGVQQFIIGLAQGLSKLEASQNEYIFFVYSNQSTWLTPYIAGNCRVLPDGIAPFSPKWRQRLKNNTILRRLWHRYLANRRPVTVPHSDGTIERMGIDLMHFTTQLGFLTDVPTIYHPWDLQHIHLPYFFTAYELQQRDTLYATLCGQAKMVSVASSWIKRDVLNHFDLDAQKIQIVPMASVLADYPQPSDETVEALWDQLPERFAYYPAQTWEHKNHIRLIQALAILRDDLKVHVPVVFSGTVNTHGKKIMQEVNRLKLNDQVTFLGYVTTEEVQALYKLCTLLVFPSRFEGWGLPISEAMSAGVPIACSMATHLPELVGNAGLTFDADDANAIAQTLAKIWRDESLSAQLAENALKRSQQFSWDRTARLFDAHYTRVLGEKLSPEHRALLNAEPIV